MTALHFDITGDCTGALNALANTESAIARVSSMSASPSVEVVGAASAISQLGGVADAATAASAAVNVSADTRGLSGAQASVAALRGEVQGMSRDLSTVGGLDVGVTGGGAVQQMSGLVRGLGGAFESAAAGMDSFADSGGRASGVGSAMERDFSGATRAVEGQTRAFQGHVQAASDLNAELEALTANHRVLQSVSAQNAASSVTGSGASRDSATGRFVSPSSEGLGAIDASPGGPDGPPPIGGGRGGRGGGGGRGGASAGGGDEDGGLPRRYLNNLAMLPMVGAAESVMTGAAGFLAVNEAIKNVPVLAAAGKVAMLDFQSGIYQAAQTASVEGVPALLHLGTTLHGLGTEIGTMGAEHMGTALSGVDELAGKATGALKNLDPAVESSMKGLVGLAGALMDGIGSSSSVNAIKTTGDALADAGNDKGFANLVNGISTVGGITATAGADILGGVGNLTGGIGQKIGALTGQDETPAVQGGLTAGAMTRSTAVGALTALGIAQAQAEESAGRGDLVTPGVVGGAAGGFAGHKLGGVKGGVAGYAIGDLAAVGGAQLDKMDGGGSSFWGDVAQYGAMGAAMGAYGGPWGALAGAALGGAAGGFISMLGDDSGGGGKPSDGASLGEIDKKSAAATKAYQADPTNLGLYQQAAFAKAVADARRTSKNNDDPMAAFMAQGPGGGGGGGGAPMVGAQGGGTWTTSGGGIGGMGGGGGGTAFDVAPPPSPSPVAGGGGMSGGGGGGDLGPVIPKGPGSSGATMSGPDMAGLGIGPRPTTGPGAAGGAGAGAPGGPNVPPGAGTPGGSDRLGGSDPRPTGGMSMDGRTTLTSGWGPDGKFQSGGTGGGQILSSLTDLRSTASNMFGAMGGLPGGGPEAAALRRDWAATGDVQGGYGAQNYQDASRYLGSDIQRGSASVFAGGQASIDAYTDRLAAQNHLARSPATGVSSGAVGGQSLPGGPPLYSGLGDSPMSNLGQQLSALGGRPGAPGEVTDAKTSPSAAAIFADYQSQPHSVGDLRWGGPSITSEGLPPGWGQPGGYDLAPASPAAATGNIVRPDPAATGGYRPGGIGMGAPPPTGGYRPGGIGMGAPPPTGGYRPGGIGMGDPYRGSLGGGSAGPAGAAQLEHLNQAMTSTTAKGAQMQQQNTALTQSLQQVSQGSQQTGQQAQSMGQHAQSIQQVASGAGQAASSVNNLGDSLKGANAAAGTSGTSLGAAMGGGGMDTGLSGFAASVGTGASAAAKGAGEATASAMASGMAQANAKVGSEASAMGSIAANAASLALKAHSPSQVFYDLGVGTGQGMVLGTNASMPAVAAAVSGGLINVLDGARGVASDYGLAVGFSYVENITTGAQQAIKSSDFQQLSTPDIKSPLAKAALGAMGLLGPAGAGAQSYQLAAREVSFGAGSPAVRPPQPITLTVSLDGAPFRQMVVHSQNALVNQLTNSISQQRSG